MDIEYSRSLQNHLLLYERICFDIVLKTRTLRTELRTVPLPLVLRYIAHAMAVREYFLKIITSQ